MLIFSGRVRFTYACLHWLCLFSTNVLTAFLANMESPLRGDRLNKKFLSSQWKHEARLVVDKILPKN